MIKGLLVGLVLFAIAAQAEVEGLGALIKDGYAEQAKVYKQIQMARTKTPTKEAQDQIQLLEDLAQSKADSGEVKMRLVSVQ